ncbi:hypothetical protein ACIF83_25115 [Streptomyces sp. NPDC085866]|uniref:hypothetical protein n=1 Tax=Streptomyces sp. NPDC085866 TaxID=3365736 RepID=UPI0037D233D0
MEIDVPTGYHVGAPAPAVCAINDFSVWFFVWDDRHDRDAVHGRTAAWCALQRALEETLRAPDRHRGHDEQIAAWTDPTAPPYVQDSVPQDRA